MSLCSFNPIGLKHRGERQRMYQYALMDPKNEPFVALRYHLVPSDQAWCNTVSRSPSLGLESWEEHIRSSTWTPSPVLTSKSQRQSSSNPSPGISLPSRGKTGSSRCFKEVIHGVLKRKDGGRRIRRDGSRSFDNSLSVFGHEDHEDEEASGKLSKSVR